MRIKQGRLHCLSCLKISVEKLELESQNFYMKIYKYNFCRFIERHTSQLDYLLYAHVSIYLKHATHVSSIIFITHRRRDENRAALLFKRKKKRKLFMQIRSIEISMPLS